MCIFCSGGRSIQAVILQCKNILIQVEVLYKHKNILNVPKVKVLILQNGLFVNHIYHIYNNTS